MYTDLRQPDARPLEEPGLDADPTVTIAVLTYRRPQKLAEALPRLVEAAGELDPPATVVVIDNDPHAGAAALVAAWGAQGVVYRHEPRPGIAAARNLALDVASTDALVFIDDDEQPAAQWLTNLVACWRDSGADAVTGPVEPVFDEQPGPWIVGTGRFDRRQIATGTRLRSAQSNNLLLDLRSVRRYGLRFDDRFGLSGGEDTVFTHDLVARGGRIAWCDEAVVRESVPIQRTTRSWVLRREFRTGTTWSRMRLVLTPAPRRWLTRLDLVARATVWIAVSAARAAFAAARGDVRRGAKAQARLAANAGMLVGAVGLRYLEYGRERPGSQPIS